MHITNMLIVKVYHILLRLPDASVTIHQFTL
jgi:hypothetical protein